ncbi:TenA family transcriptional regulator [Aliikangiella maris]|uniref:Iron-containing redox enzyme family protein n=2 Tax=Aliikangiella maris TaxID=3162458 RepID=A0ABV2BPR4_9GAMM
MTTTTVQLESKIKQLAADLDEHPFLARCRDGSISLDELKSFMLQQGLYSNFFTRYLCAMMANLPNNHYVLELAENLFEELGLEPGSPKPHSVMYREMLESFSIEFDFNKINDSTQKLIDTMFEYCKNPNPAFGLGALCLGAEAVVPSLYSSIVKGFQSHGIDNKQIEFFLLHIECDDGHAETLNDIMREIAEQESGQLENMFKAGEALIQARLDFFTAIEEEFQSEVA